MCHYAIMQYTMLILVCVRANTNYKNCSLTNDLITSIFNLLPFQILINLSYFSVVTVIEYY